MNLLSISMRNLRIRVLSSTLTMLSIALGAALIASIWLMIGAADRHYKASVLGYSAVVGPKQGSALDIVLSAVLNYRSPPGIVKLPVYKDVRDGPLSKLVGTRYAIPQARGDSYEGFPLIGTTDEMFTEFSRGDPEKVGAGLHRGKLTFAAGKKFDFGHEDLLVFAQALADRQNALEGEATSNGVGKAPDHAGHDHAGHDHAGHGHDHAHLHFDPQFFAVLGSEAAAKTGLAIGDHFFPVHGGSDAGIEHVHDESPCKVVGILEPTHSAIDRSIYLPMSGFVSFEGHGEGALRPDDPTQEPTADDMVFSYVILDTRDHLGAQRLRHAFEARADAQVAWPALELAHLHRMIGGGKELLTVLSWLVILVAALSILVALYNTMNERRREIAIMRALGARRNQILSIIVLEAFLISLVGAVLGVLACHAAAFWFFDLVVEQTTVPLDWTAFSVDELGLIGGVALLGCLSGILPAIKGSITPVAENLGPTS